MSSADQHSELRSAAFFSRVKTKAVQYLRLRELPRASAGFSASALTRREHSSVYKRWLSGVEGAAKRSQTGYTPTNRSRYTDNVATAFGRRRVRFPASGRRKKSYDSLLHAFAKKVSASHFRRASRLRFVSALPKLSSSFTENLSAFTPMFGANRRRTVAGFSSAYLSAPWREALVQKTSAVNAPRLPAKRRFLSLPTHTVFFKKQKLARSALSPYKQQMSIIRTGVLRRALRRRRQERAFIDLRQSALQRRLPKEKARQRPKDYRYAKRRRAAKRGPFRRTTSRRWGSTVPGVWTLRHLSAVGPRAGQTQRSSLPPVLSHGEVVALDKVVLRRKAEAVRGFVLPVQRQKAKKLRRRNRDTRLRKRRSRRAKRASRRAVTRNTKHWSEKRDQRFRNTTFAHKKLGQAKIVARKLHGRLDAKFTFNVAAARRATLASRKRLEAFSSRAALYVGSGQNRYPAVPVPSVILKKSSSLQRRRSAINVYKRSRLSVLQARGLHIGGVAARKRQFKLALSRFREQNRSLVPERLVSSVMTGPAAAALWFQRPVTRIIKSAAAKEQDALAEIAIKEDRFKLTAQYVESVTAFIPELMNYMLSRKIENKNINYSTAQHMVRNIYWSLRVYLNVDPFDVRFFLRDKTPAARVRLFEDISDLSESQKTLQPQRAVLRYRFQPGRILLARNTNRFRGDWLRAFFPAKHALYQENPEDYRHFLVKTYKIRRLRIGPRGMESWITTQQLVGHETRARQLLGLRFSRTRARFETVLQTTRRAPTTECAPAAAASALRSSFFARPFSTYANRGLSLTTRWIHRKKRFVSLESGWRTLAPLALATARQRVISRIEARAKSKFVNTERHTMAHSLLDSRFTRTKSPRSSQYLLRTSKIFANYNKQRKITDIIFYRSLLQSRPLIGGPTHMAYWSRSARKSYSAVFNKKHVTGKLASVRTKSSFRRVQDAQFLRGASGVGESVQPVLRYRAARGRTSAILHRKPLAIFAGALFSSQKFRALQTFGAGAGKLKISRKQFLQRLLIKPKWSVVAKKVRTRSLNTRCNGFAARANIKYKRHFSEHFGSESGRKILQSMDFARACGLYTRFYQQTPFDTYRPRLWNKLSLRWMKKYRLGRYWLRDTSRWLRDPWLSEIVAADMTLRRDRFGGELRSRPQQVGEYVAEVDSLGRDIRRKDAPRERHKFQKIMPVLPIEKDPEIKKTNKVLKRGSATDKIITKHRMIIAGQALRKPVPTMRLANYEYRDVIREHKDNKAKSSKQKAEEEQSRVKAYWSRKAKKLPPLRPLRLPLKHPANLWLPHVIWKEIQRRVRKFEWRESDEVFFRKGFRAAFRFRSNERRKAPWLEHLMYTRATYSTRLREFRRRQYPHEQKKFKWLQRVRRMLYPGRKARYIKWRRWPQLRRYNQKLHYSLFNLRDRGAARRRFKRSNGRTRPAISGFVSMSRGLTDRLDVTCLKMGFAPTIYWARIVSEFGLLRVNGVTVYNPSYQLKPADVIYPNWDTIAKFQHYFKPQLQFHERGQRKNKASTAFYPTNMEYHRGIRAITYKHAPDESDLRRSGRIRPAYFRWFRLDSA
jgi:ribosomal protein S4